MISSVYQLVTQNMEHTYAERIAMRYYNEAQQVVVEKPIAPMPTRFAAPSPACGKKSQTWPGAKSASSAGITITTPSISSR